MKTRLVLAFVYVCSPCWAQTSSPAASVPAARADAVAPPATVTSAGFTAGGESAGRGEPNVKHTVIEDEGSKIDELRVRGQVKRITVTPKVGTGKSYEILVGPGGQDFVDGTGGSRGTTGQRVWNVLAF